MSIFVEHVPQRRALGEAPPIVLPHRLVRAVVEIEEFEILELARRRRKKLLAKLDVRVHRSADVEEEQQLHRIVAFRAHPDIEPALARGAVDRLVEIELLGRAFACETAKSAKRDLDVASPELDIIVEVPELPLVPDLDRASVAAALLADPDAFRII